MNYTNHIVIAGFAIATLLANPAPAPDVAVVADGDNYVLQLDQENGESLVDFLDLMGVLLDTPIEYSPTEVGDTRLFVTGAITIAKQDLRSFVEMMLETKSFLLVEQSYGERAILRVIRNARSRSTPHMSSYGIIVPEEDMEAWKDRRALVTTSISLHDINSRSAMASFSPYVGESIGTIRNVEASNSLIITAPANAVYKMLEIVRAVDIRSEWAMSPTDLEQRLSQFESRLSALEEG